MVVHMNAKERNNKNGYQELAQAAQPSADAICQSPAVVVLARLVIF
jgi:hypothetical protein